MFDRIVEMSLTLDEEYMQSSSTFGGRVRLMGAPDPFSAPATTQVFDAQIVEASGLEMSEIVVFGGDLYGGGSKFTGTRMADREIDLSLVPIEGTSASEIKNKLSALAGTSARIPLTLRVDYETYHPDDIGTTFGDFGTPSKSVWETKVYISNITAPIFADSSEVNVTLSMGDTTFVRGSMLEIKGAVADGEDRTGVSEMRRTGTPFEGSPSPYILYRSFLLSQADLDVIAAPSTGYVNASIKLGEERTLADIKHVFVDDYSGGNIVAYDLSELDQDAKEIGVHYHHDTGRLYVWTGSLLRPSYDAKCRISGKLPLFRPARDSFRIGVGVEYNIKDGVDIEVEQAHVRPGRYGF